MTSLSTTQSFGSNANFIAGSLSFLKVTLKDAKQKYWSRTIEAAASANLIAGNVYTVVDPGSGANAATAAEWKAIGLVKNDGMGTDQLPVAGDTFTAAASGVAEGGNVAFPVATFGNTTGGAEVSIDNKDAGLAKLIQSVQSRASIVYVGKVTLGTDEASVRLMIENAGHEDYSRANDQKHPKGELGYPTGDARELERALREQEREFDANGNPTTVDADSIWKVEQFVF